jgi:hypothetical protein
MPLDAPAADLQSAASTEAGFQQLYEQGAFNADGKPDLEQPSPEAPGTQAAAADPRTAAAEPEAPADDGPEFNSLEDYLAKSNVEASSFYELPVTVKIDGKTSQVKLSDVVKSYQLEGHVHAKSAAVAEAQRAFESQRQQAANEISGRIAAADTMAKMLHQQLLGEFNGIDWNTLRAQDPVAWSVKTQEFNLRANQIQAHLAQVNQAQQRLAQEREEQIQKQLPVEQEKLQEARPEWRDPKQFQAARADMSDYARKLGFSDAELSSVFDHRLMLVLHDAARYAALQAASPNAVKRVRTAPVAAQPGARTSRDPQSIARTQAKEAFTKDRRNVDAQARYFGTLS